MKNTSSQNVNQFFFFNLGKKFNKKYVQPKRKPRDFFLIFLGFVDVVVTVSK